VIQIEMKRLKRTAAAPKIPNILRSRGLALFKKLLILVVGFATVSTPAILSLTMMGDAT
jgi:hypothetical protein